MRGGEGTLRVEYLEKGPRGCGCVGGGRELDFLSKSRDLERYVDGDEGRERERERERDRRRRELLEMRGLGSVTGVATGISEYEEGGGGNAAIGWDGVSESALDDGLGHVIRTFGARSLKLRSKEVRV